jgi:hypothetical protein
MSSTHGRFATGEHTLAAGSVPDTQFAVARLDRPSVPVTSNSSRLAGPDGSRLAYTQRALDSRDARPSGPVASSQRAVRATARGSAASGVGRVEKKRACVRAVSVQRGLEGGHIVSSSATKEGSSTEASQQALAATARQASALLQCI